MRGPGGPRGPGGAPALEPPPLASAPGDARRTPPKRNAHERSFEDREGRLKSFGRRFEPTPLPVVDREIVIGEGITVKELSEKLGVKGNIVVKRLFEMKIFATINQTLDVKIADEVAKAFGATVRQMTYEEEAVEQVDQAQDPAELKMRAPVVTIMGHVDHGKTSLLDAIRETTVAAREAGGITQHIGAYYVEKNNRKIVFIDTPGHEAFTRMRARGAKVTDIVVLVVAADDGVMPQTIEAINHAKAAGVPMIVAINKIDKPEANVEKIKKQLSDRGLVPEEYGGDTVMVEVSAKARLNLDGLLDMILLVADIQDLKANPTRTAVGTVLEAELDKGRGPIATVLVRNGTLRVGDNFICGAVLGRVRAMFDDRGGPLREAEPSMPVEVLGFEAVPDVGDTFQVVTDTAKAKQIVFYREAKNREQSLARQRRVSLDTLSEQMREGDMKELLLVIKADVGGTGEVLSDTLQKLSNEQVRIRVLATGIGAITESDVLLASASNAVIIGFNVRPDRSAQSVAEQEKVDIRLHTIIYELVDEVKKAMTGLLEPIFKEVFQGRAEVRQVFRLTKAGTVAGSFVTEGFIKRSSEVRVVRDGTVVYTGKVEALKRFKDDVSEVKQGFECGISIQNYNDFKEGDIFEAFMMEKVAAILLGS